MVLLPLSVKILPFLYAKRIENKPKHIERLVVPSAVGCCNSVGVTHRESVEAVGECSGSTTPRAERIAVSPLLGEGRKRRRKRRLAIEQAGGRGLLTRDQ